MRKVNCTPKTFLDDALRRAKNEELLLMRDGHAIAMVIPFDDEDLKWYVRERHPAFLTSIARARKQIKEGKTTSHNKLKKDLGLQKPSSGRSRGSAR